MAEKWDAHMEERKVAKRAVKWDKRKAVGRGKWKVALMVVRMVVRTAGKKAD